MNDKVESPTVQYGKGSYFVPADRNPWPHEILTAKALSKAGYDVVFLSEKGSPPICDAIIEGNEWEFKSPKTNKLSQIQENLKKANRKSSYIIIDSCRIIRLPDKIVQTYLAKMLKGQKSIKKLWYINRQRIIIDISDLV